MPGIRSKSPGAAVRRGDGCGGGWDWCVCRVGDPRIISKSLERKANSKDRRGFSYNKLIYPRPFFCLFFEF